MPERLETKVSCRMCGRYGTRGFVPDPRPYGDGMVCKAAKACYRRWYRAVVTTGKDGS